MCDSVSVPCVANGDVFTYSDYINVAELTNCAGVMSANGILDNPSLFSDCDTTNLECVAMWYELFLWRMKYHLHDLGWFACFHTHLIRMLPTESKGERTECAQKKSVASVTSFVLNRWSRAEEFKERFSELCELLVQLC